MNPAIRHEYEPSNRFAPGRVGGPKACRCGKAKGNPIHALGTRCSVCFRFIKRYEADSSRRCNDCAP
jgi:hypothetical protein